MDQAKSKRLLIYAAVIFWILALMIFLIAGKEFSLHYELGEAPAPAAIVGQITEETRITQTFVCPVDVLTDVELLYGPGSGQMNVRLVDDTGAEAASGVIEIPVSRDDRYLRVPMSDPIDGAAGRTFTLELSGSAQTAEGHPASIYYGTASMQDLFGDTENVGEDERYTINGAAGAGKLCVRASGMQKQIFGKLYWPVMAGVFLLLFGYVVHCWKMAKRGRSNVVTMLCTVCCRYSFLLKQLILRDFKKKYKRSVLGMAWSFLNPLLTMCVQYIVFSVVFRNNTPNYPLYLLIGVVFFNFFSESVTMGMNTILENSNLIKKVYVPKYVYPTSKVFSTLINFGLSFIPIFLVMILSGAAFRVSMLLVLYDSICLLMFVTGMVLFMCTLKTFFVDMQFLWGVFQMMWMYLTPIFYPESIIPARFIKLYRLNPMYQYINFARICIIDGRSPAATSYLWCFLSAAAVLALGVYVFRKNQDKFILYL